jgi:Fe-S-cluster-containing dehydrogenase component
VTGKLKANPTLCIGCYACIIACQQEKDLAPGEALIQVDVLGPFPRKDGLKFDVQIRFCQHCDDAPCEATCPEQAIKQTEEGFITVDQNLCNGCRACVDECVVGRIVYREESHTVMMCDLCQKDGVLHPQCAKHCPAEALVFNEM